MQMRNPSTSPIGNRDLGIMIPPGGTAEVPDAYCLPRKGTNGDPIKPIVAMLMPQLEPANPDLVAAYRANKLVDGLHAEPVKPRSAADFVADGVAPAVAELMASGNAGTAPKTIPVVKK